MSSSAITHGITRRVIPAPSVSFAGHDDDERTARRRGADCIDRVTRTLCGALAAWRIARRKWTSIPTREIANGARVDLPHLGPAAEA